MLDHASKDEVMSFPARQVEDKGLGRILGVQGLGAGDMARQAEEMTGTGAS